MANKWGNNGNSDRLYFLGLQNHCVGDCGQEIERHLLLGRKTMTNLDSVFERRDITLPITAHLVKGMVFPVVMSGCESLIIKEGEHQRMEVLEKTLESPLDCKEIQPVLSKGDQSWVFIGKTDIEAETPILWPPDGKN